MSKHLYYKTKGLDERSYTTMALDYDTLLSKAKKFNEYVTAISGPYSTDTGDSVLVDTDKHLNIQNGSTIYAVPEAIDITKLYFKGVRIKLLSSSLSITNLVKLSVVNLYKYYLKYRYNGVTYKTLPNALYIYSLGGYIPKGTYDVITFGKMIDTIYGNPTYQNGAYKTKTWSNIDITQNGKKPSDTSKQSVRLYYYGNGSPNLYSYIWLTWTKATNNQYFWRGENLLGIVTYCGNSCAGALRYGDAWKESSYFYYGKYTITVNQDIYIT